MVSNWMKSCLADLDKALPYWHRFSRSWTGSLVLTMYRFSNSLLTREFAFNNGYQLGNVLVYEHLHIEEHL